LPGEPTEGSVLFQRFRAAPRCACRSSRDSKRGNPLANSIQKSSKLRDHPTDSREFFNPFTIFNIIFHYPFLKTDKSKEKCIAAEERRAKCGILE